MDRPLCHPLGDRLPRVAVRTGKARILVVDDDRDTRFLLRLIFEGAEYEVEEAHNGAAAVRVVQDEPPDIVVTDIVMPVMDGVALIGALRSDALTARLPILAVSGSPEIELAAARADAVLGKPFDNAELLAVVSSLLARGDTAVA